MSNIYETSQIDIPLELDDNDTENNTHDVQISDHDSRIVTLENAPLCSAYISGAQNPYTTVQDIRVDTINVNYGGFSLVNYKLVIPLTGYYKISFSQLTQVTPGGHIYIGAYNGASHRAYRSWSSTIPYAALQDVMTETIGYFTAGTQIAPYISGISGSVYHWGGDHSLYIVEWIGP